MTPPLNPDILSFFAELETNNNREWFEPQKKRFKALEAEMKQFSADLVEAMNEHDSIDRYKLFRLYRDVRFSKDKTPFKTHFGISFHREKPALRGEFITSTLNPVITLSPPALESDKDDLKRIRKEMEIDAEEFRDIMAEPSFKKGLGQPRRGRSKDGAQRLFKRRSQH